MDDLQVAESRRVVGPGAAPALGGPRAAACQVVTIAGDGLPGRVDAVGRAARFHWPWGVAVDGAGHVYVADSGNNCVRKIAPDGAVTTVAGDGTAGHRDGAGRLARFGSPRGIATDAAGNLYVADTDNDRIRKITPQGEVATHCGGGARALLDGARASAGFYHPNSVVLDATGTVYVADASNRAIRKISPGGTATTLAGEAIGGYADGIGPEARFNSPRAIALDGAGHLYVAEHGNSRIRKVTPDGRVTTFAGDGRGRHVDGPAATASFRDPCGVAVDAAGNVYVADSYNHCIRRIRPDEVVETIAGDPGAPPDFADATGPSARFNTPMGICLGPDGALYVADMTNHCIRRIEVS